MATPEYDWYLSEWMATQGLRQAQIVEVTGWPKSKVSKMVNNKLRTGYARDMVNQLASILNIHPHELLMHPVDAFAIRRMHESAVRIVSDPTHTFRPEPRDILERKSNG